MSVATKKVLPATGRFQLIRLKPARYITTGMVSAGSGLYTYTFGRAVAFASLQYNGSTSGLTNDGSGTPSVAGHYVFDESTGTPTIKLAGTPGGTDHFVLFYYLFFTEGEWKQTYQTPSDSATTARLWDPRLARAATVRASFRNVLAGKLTYEDTSFSLDNKDYGLQPFLSDDDSFANKDVDIWQVLRVDSDADAVPSDGIQKLFTGKVGSISVGAESVDLQAYESLYALKQTADLGGATSLIYNSSTGYPGHIGKAKPYIFGATSYYKTINDSAIVISGATETGRRLSDCYEGVCTAYSSLVGTSTNRSWAFGYVKTGLPTQSFGSITRATRVAGGNVQYVFFSSISNVYVGDTISWNQSGTPEYGIVALTGVNFTYGGNTYNTVISTDRMDLGSSWLSIDTLSTMNAKKSLGVIITGYSQYPLGLRLTQGQDYTLSETVVTSGNCAVTISLANNFEALYGISPTAIGAIDPNKHKMLYRMGSSADQTHGTVLQQLLEAAGLTVDSTSISTANAALTDACAFSIPYKDETTVRSFEEYVLAILRSSLGYVRLTTTGTVEYKLYAAPSSTSDRPDYVTLDKSVKVGLEYRDLATTLRFTNKHLPVGTNGVVTPSESSSKARYLHGLAKTEDYEHVFALNGSSELTRQDQIFALRSNRRGLYSYDVATEDLDTVPGDDVQLTHSQVLGTAGVKDLKVTGVSKSTDKVSVDAEDMLGL